MNAHVLAFIFVGCALFVAMSVRPFLRFAVRFGLVDLENDRTLHEGAVPRGGGVVIVLVALGSEVVCIVLNPGDMPILLPLMIATLTIAVVGFLDDLKGLSSTFRLVAGVMCSIAFLLTLPSIEGSLIIGELARLVFLGIMMAWIINAFNFMDGADGLLASQSLLIFLGIVGVFLLLNLRANSLMYISCALAGATMGFLYWNWMPAKVFLGDVGSYGLGFSIAGFGMIAPHYGLNGVVILILVAPIMTDATMTLSRRFFSRERWWEAHHSHVYQLYIRSGISHQRVVVTLAGLELGIFIPLAIFAAKNSPYAVAAAGLAYVLAGLLWLIAYFRIGIVERIR